MTPGPLMTFTTDFGTRDGYVGAMKGVALRICPEARLVDISHEIPPQDLLHAARVLEDSTLWFPEESVHVAVIDPGVGTSRRAILVRAHRRWFIAPDNGILWPLASRDPERQCWDISGSGGGLEARSSTFHGRDLFTPVAAHLAAGKAPEALGVPCDDLLPLEGPAWAIDGNVLRGEVVQVDHFGNLISNIPVSALGGREMATARVVGSGEHLVKTMVETYAEAEGGLPVALVGSSGYLEVAINQGSAAEALQEGKGAGVEVELL